MKLGLGLELEIKVRVWGRGKGKGKKLGLGFQIKETRGTLADTTLTSAPSEVSFPSLIRSSLTIELLILE